MNTLQSVSIRGNPESKGLSPEAHRKHRRIKEMQRELDKMKLDFTAIANTYHDLQTLMHSMYGSIKMMLDGKVPELEMQQQFLAIVDKQNQRLTNMLINILDMAAFESGQMVFDRQSVSLQTLIGEVVVKLQNLAAEKEIIIETSFSGTIPNIHGDPDKLEHVVTNLLGSAIEISPGKCNIFIHVSENNNKVLVQVTGQHFDHSDDNSPLQRPERLSMLDSSVPLDNGGNWIGLYLARRIIEAHGGRLWAKVESGEGGVFGFVIPCRSISAGSVRHQEETIIRDMSGQGSSIEDTEQIDSLPEYNPGATNKKSNSKRSTANIKDKSPSFHMDERKGALLLSALSRQEVEILNLIAQGNSNSDIAVVFNRSERTIKNQITSIYRKLGVNNRTNAVMLALKHNVIKTGIPGTQEMADASISSNIQAEFRTQMNNYPAPCEAGHPSAI